MEKIELPHSRKVGHLTLHREPRDITLTEFNALNADERLDIIRAAQGNQKYELLLASNDNQELVAKIPAQELYLLITERGLVDAEELTNLVTAEQFNLFTDFDCWKKDQINGEDVLPWLATLLDRDDETLMRILYGIDFDFLTITAQRFMSVVHGPEVYEDDDQRQEALNRDGGYEINYINEDAGKLFGMLFVQLFKLDQMFFSRLLESIRGEVGSELEEECYRRRNNRLADLGFPDPHEAHSVYQRIDPDRFDFKEWQKGKIFPPDDEQVAPSFALAATTPGNLLAKAVTDHVSDEFCWELTYLLNKALSCNGINIGDSEQISATASDVGNYLNLGLEYCSGGDVEKAQEILALTYLQSLFQLGYSLSAKLTDRANLLAKTAINPYLDQPFQDFLLGLRQSPPHLQVPDKDGKPTEQVVSSLADIEMANSRLARLDMLNELFTGALPFSLPLEIDLSGCRPTANNELTLGHFLLTALCNQVLGHDFIPTPIAEYDLHDLHSRLDNDGEVAETIHQSFTAYLEELVPGAGAYANYVLEVLEDDFLAIDPDDIDPRFIGRLIIRLT